MGLLPSKHDVSCMYACHEWNSSYGTHGEVHTLEAKISCNGKIISWLYSWMELRCDDKNKDNACVMATS